MELIKQLLEMQQGYLAEAKKKAASKVEAELDAVALHYVACKQLQGLANAYEFPGSSGHLVVELEDVNDVTAQDIKDKYENKVKAAFKELGVTITKFTPDIEGDGGTVIIKYTGQPDRENLEIKYRKWIEQFDGSSVREENNFEDLDSYFAGPANPHGKKIAAALKKLLGKVYNSQGMRDDDLFFVRVNGDGQDVDAHAIEDAINDVLINTQSEVSFGYESGENNNEYRYHFNGNKGDFE